MSPNIRELTLEKDVLALVTEFLGDYFDGNPHNVGLNQNVTFPKATIVSQESALPERGAVLGITCVWGGSSSRQKRWDVVNGVAQEIVYEKTAVNFWVRAEMAAGPTGNARTLCQNAAQLLSGLLQNSAETRQLSQKGIHRIRPGNPQAISDTNYVLRLMSCRFTLRYAVNSQLTDPLTGGANTLITSDSAATT